MKRNIGVLLSLLAAASPVAAKYGILEQEDYGLTQEAADASEASLLKALAADGWDKNLKARLNFMLLENSPSADGKLQLAVRMIVAFYDPSRHDLAEERRGITFPVHVLTEDVACDRFPDCASELESRVRAFKSRQGSKLFEPAARLREAENARAAQLGASDESQRKGEAAASPAPVLDAQARAALEGIIKDRGDRLAKDAKDARAYHDRGTAYLGLGDYKAAAADLDKAVELSEGDQRHEARVRRFEAYRRGGLKLDTRLGDYAAMRESLSAERRKQDQAFGVPGLRTLVVAQDGSGDYADIREAATRASRGETILVRKGNYSMLVPMSGLTYVGEPGAVLDSILFLNKTRDVRISGFSVRHGVMGAGESVILDNLRISKYPGFAGFYFEKGWVGYGGGIALWSVKDWTVADCEIENFDAGIQIDGSENVKLLRNTIHHTRVGIKLNAGKENSGIIIDGNTVVKSNVGVGTDQWTVFLWEKEEEKPRTKVSLSLKNNLLAYNAYGVSLPFRTDLYSLLVDYKLAKHESELRRPGDSVQAYASKNCFFRNGVSDFRPILFSAGEELGAKWLAGFGSGTGGSAVKKTIKQAGKLAEPLRAMNLFSEPGFVDAASNNFRLAAGSPLLTAGEGGALVGALGPEEGAAKGGSSDPAEFR